MNSGKTLIVMMVLAVAALIGCTPAPTGRTSTDSAVDAPAAAAKSCLPDQRRVGDNAFYDSGQAGIDQLATDYGVETRTIETNFDAASMSHHCRLRWPMPM